MTVQALVAARVGVAVMPRLVASVAVRNEVVILPLARGTLTRTVSSVSRRAGFSSDATTTMQALLHRVAASLACGPLAVDVPVAGVALAASKGCSTSRSGGRVGSWTRARASECSKPGSRLSSRSA